MLDLQTMCSPREENYCFLSPHAKLQVVHLFMEICMREKRRIKTLQKIVERLQMEKQQLLAENKKLQEDLDFEITKQEKNQETQKRLEAELNECIHKYEKLIEDTQKLKAKYKKESHNFKKLRMEYSKKINKVIKSIKQDFDVK